MIRTRTKAPRIGRAAGGLLGEQAGRLSYFVQEWTKCARACARGLRARRPRIPAAVCSFSDERRCLLAELEQSSLHP